MKKFIIICLVLILSLSTVSCLAASNDNALAAIALYVDTSGYYIPGTDMLNKALNEVIRFKINALLLGSEVQSGNEVLRDLSRCNVSSSASASPESLASYAANRHVNFIILFSVRPLDVAIDLKAYSAASNSYLIDKTVTRPEGTEAWSTLEALSSMIGGEVTQVLQALNKP
ncbi:hypothetical protein [Dendrosporobacter sp. 1207_IL3150]|uniref:hypothetical protein n=1 Tax=Dendrosporobacter sp. 1207_IL3150 TaxID=3084054 RepID=UPI002FDB6062